MGVTSNWCHPQGHHARRPPTTVPNNDLSPGVLHLLSQFGGFVLNGWWVISWTNLWYTYTHTQMQATTVPESLNWPRVKKLRWSDGQESSDSQPFFPIKFELGANKSYLTWFLFTGFPSIGIPSIMISGSIYHIFIMGIPALVKQHLYTEITAICMAHALSWFETESSQQYRARVSILQMIRDLFHRY